MNENCFTMYPQKSGRIKYLLLTLVPPILLQYLLLILVDWQILRLSEAVFSIIRFVPILSIAILGYFLIFKKYHTVTVEDHTISNTSMRGITTAIPLNEISSYKKNLLNEIPLLDANSKVLLCVEANMENFDWFLHWLEQHHINTKGDIS